MVDGYHIILRIAEKLILLRNEAELLNFVETMALYRAFSVGRFRCSGISPKIITSDFSGGGYNIVIRKESARKFCLGCIREFVKKRPLYTTEDEKFLIIYHA